MFGEFHQLVKEDGFPFDLENLENLQYRENEFGKNSWKSYLSRLLVEVEHACVFSACSERKASILETIPVADSGFSRGGCANSQIGIILQFFCRKLHENERIWTPGGEEVPGAPLRSANTYLLSVQIFDSLELYLKNAEKFAKKKMEYCRKVGTA